MTDALDAAATPERECSVNHCEYPYGPCCGAIERNRLHVMGQNDLVGHNLLLALRKDVGDDLVNEIEANFEGGHPLFHTLAFLNLYRRSGELVSRAKLAPADGAAVERVARALNEQMEAQADDTIPSSIRREKGLVWLEGWFDLSAALAAMGEG